jgi:hypothetical protein
MVQTCTKCSRANPRDAVYCYYDGMVLNGHGRAGGPVAVGLQAFASPFVFPSGKVCRNFNELALACQDDWSAAKDLLQQGFLGGFLGGLGRIDLAMAAKQAAAFPDHDRGLDELLGKLPADVLHPPKLSLETQEINLGHTPFGTTRKLELRMENLGGRLLYGTVSCSEGWLSFGDQPGISQKAFQFTHELTLPVRVVGDRLRASNKPIETQIVIESSGGTKTVVVRAQVPVKPFPPGVLGGSKSPRQVAEKAKANPKEAAALFERGEVRNWYKDNGWTYPVQGRDSSGLGAVQQFFEALGLTPAPKVDVSQRSIGLAGNAGQRLHHVIEVKTEEKRPVYADGTSDSEWLEVGRAKLNGRVATIPLTVSVPNKPGHTLSAKLTVLANGNQRFVIPVNLQVGGTYVPAPPVAALAVPARAAMAAVPVAAAVVASPVVSAMPVAASPFEDELSAIATSRAAPIAAPRTSSRRDSAPTDPARAFLHLIPAGLLLVAVLSVVIVDVVKAKQPAGDSTSQVDPKKKPDAPPDHPDEDPQDPTKNVTPPKEKKSDWYDKKTLKDSAPRLGLAFSDDDLDGTMRFGLVMEGVPDPRPEYAGKFKKLTYWEKGTSNNTIVKIGTSEWYFGKRLPRQNEWTGPKGANKNKKLPDGRVGRTSEMEFRVDSGIRVKQHVEIVPGDSRLLDTCLVLYTITNYGDTRQTVGLRVMLDTYIGANDGVPFQIPGERGFLTTKGDYDQKHMPDYIEAVENPDDPNNVGTVVRMGLKGIHLPGIGYIEDINLLRICRWPKDIGNEAGWEWEPVESMDKIPDAKDSCVVLYWAHRLMSPGEVRHMAFTYGLSKLEISGSGNDEAPAPPAKDETAMAMSVPGQVFTNSEFVVTGYLWRTKPGQKVKLKLPDSGLTLADGEKAEKVLEETGPGRVKVEWKVRAGATGTYKIQATSEQSKTRPREIEVKDPKKTSIFG